MYFEFLLFCIASEKAEAILSYYVLSSKMSSAIFTSCFELSCFLSFDQAEAGWPHVCHQTEKRLGKVSDTFTVHSKEKK